MPSMLRIVIVALAEVLGIALVGCVGAVTSTDSDVRSCERTPATGARCGARDGGVPPDGGPWRDADPGASTDAARSDVDGSIAAIDGGATTFDGGDPSRDGGGPGEAACGDRCRYVRAGASGRGDGSRWADALPSLPSTLERGAIYLVADGAYEGYSFDDAADGRTITIAKATASAHGTDEGWDPSYGDGQAVFGALTFASDDYDLDGRVGGGVGQWESGLGFRIRSGGHNVHLEGDRRNIRIAHTDIENNGRYSTGHGGNEHSVYGIGAISDITLAYDYLHDVNGVHLLTRGSRRVTIEHTKLARNGPAGFDGGHREAWSASDDDDATIRFSVFEDISNTAVIGLVNGEGDAERWQIYGNVFWQTETITDAAVSALISVRYAAPHFITARDWAFHHNTIVNVEGLGAGFDIASAIGMEVYGNVWLGNEVNIIAFPDGVDHDYDWFADNLRTDGCSPACDLDPGLVASEPNGELGAGDPFVDWRAGDFALRAATAPGLALPSPFDVDMLGHVRGADGTWDRGAIEHR
jgi:hypothetical protein